MACSIPYVRPVGWGRGCFLFSVRDITRSDDVTSDWSNGSWVDVMRDIRLRHSRHLLDVL